VFDESLNWRASMFRKGIADSIGRADQAEAAIAEEVYERPMQQAKSLLDQGFHLGDAIPTSRNEWHDR
jgi:hypothetical protein